MICTDPDTSIKRQKTKKNLDFNGWLLNEFLSSKTDVFMYLQK